MSDNKATPSGENSERAAKKQRRNQQPNVKSKLEDAASPAVPMYLECPAELPPFAREEWNRIVGELIALGILSKFDRGPLAVYCGAFAMWAEAMEALQEFGTMIKSPSGYPVQSPYIAIVNRQA